jgi:signal transduction histidine kinase
MTLRSPSGCAVLGLFIALLLLPGVAGAKAHHSAKRPTTLEIAVRDSGPGVPEALRARIFEPFFSTKRRETETGGMGLGLSLVHRSVTAVGGRISVRDADGGGAQFLVELPLDAAPKGAPT